ncbi:MAG: amidase family protein [Acidimicrobiales bacterium]
MADLDLALGLMSGPNLRRRRRGAWKAARTAPARLAGFRVAAWFDDDACRSIPVETVLHGLADLLDAAGCHIDRSARPGFPLGKVIERFFAPCSAPALAGAQADHPRGTALATGDDRLTSASDRHVRHRQWLSNNESRLQMRLKFEQFFQGLGHPAAAVMPCGVAFRHDHSGADGRPHGHHRRPAARDYWQLNRWMAPAGACCLPGTVIPVGLAASGLPVGVQIVGPYLHDRTTLAFAAARWRSLVGPCPAPPGFD